MLHNLRILDQDTSIAPMGFCNLLVVGYDFAQHMLCAAFCVQCAAYRYHAHRHDVFEVTASMEQLCCFTLH